MSGMNVTEVRRIGARLGAEADGLERLTRAIDATVRTAQQHWRGRDVDLFDQAWAGHTRAQCSSLVAVLRQLGESARRNAEEQLTASAAEPSGIGGGPSEQASTSAAAAPTGTAPASDLSAILRDYQVRDDEQREWEPGGLLSLFTDPKLLTVREGELLDQLNPWGLKDFQSAHDKAFAVADEQYPPSGGGPMSRNDNHNDAFRHAYWNALLGSRFGDGWAEDYATAHERVPGNQPAREAMDLYNNEVGRRIARDHPGASPEELAAYVRAAEDDGELLVIDQQGKLAWSDSVAVGETGHPPEDAQPLEGKDPAMRGDRARS